MNIVSRRHVGEEASMTPLQSPAGRAKPECPVIHGQPYDLHAYEMAADPYPWLAAARREVPVFYLPQDDVWCVTRHEDIETILTDCVTFSSREAQKYKDPSHPMMQAAFPGGEFLGHGLVNADPPRHGEMRRVLRPQFLPRVISKLDHKVRAICAELLGPLIPRGEFDFLADFSAKLPARVIAILIGAPVEQAAELSRWASENFHFTAGTPLLPAEKEKEVLAHARTYYAWLCEHVDSRIRAPQDDFTSVIVHATDASGQPALTVEEARAHVSGMVTAGIDTTKVFLPQMLRELLGRPHLWDLLCREPTRIPAAVEECLRLVTPVRGNRRTLKRAARLGDVDLPAGATVFLIYPSGNRDPAVFPQPDDLVLDRPNLRRHLSFGHGPHACLGAPLARLEAQVVLEMLTEELPGLRLQPGQAYEWIPNVAVPSLKSLFLEWDARPGDAD
jgi:cytochrome P450